MESIWTVVLRFCKSLRNVLKNSAILFCELGQYKSMVTNLPMDSNREPLPWYTYPMIEYINSFDFSDKIIFEWGCGNSSVFWAKRCKKIISYEDNKDWFNYVISKKRNNQDIVLCTDQQSYVKAIEKSGSLFDIIIIDGNYRSQCARLAPRFLNDGGFIIVDNSDWFHSATDSLREEGFFQIDFNGFGPVNNYTWTTSIFVRYDSVFQKKGFYSGPRPVGGLRKNVD